jgi:CelD/BcsL family acetyltransferase involved in cellulose biosynthesis
MVTNSSNEEIDHYMDLYYAVYHASWKAPEMDPSFHRDLAKLARDKGWLRLGFLFLDTSPIAAQLWLVSDGVAYIAKLAYDEGYKKLIPGVILSSEMMKYVIDIDRVKEIDYLIGDEPYKKDWTPNRRERKGILIFNNNFKGDCLALMMIKAAAIIEKNRYLKQMKRRISRYLNRTNNQ